MRWFRVLSAVVVIAAILLAVGFTPHLARAATITVGNGSYSCDQDGLATAIRDAGDGGTVTFDCPSPYTINFTSAILIREDEAQTVTIDGTNTSHPMIFDGGDQTNFFVVATDGNLTVKHLTMQQGIGRTNGGTYPEGGAIDVDKDGSLTVADVTFNDNHAQYGGAIDNDDGTATITQSTFTNSTTDDAGGAIYNNGSLTVTQSTFTSNSTVFFGGAIFNEGSLTVTQSTFTNSATGDAGGAIFNNGSLTVTQSTFTSNSTVLYGGAIYNDNELTVTQSTFSGNKANWGSTIYVIGPVDIAWSTIIQPDGEDHPALLLNDDITLTGVILGGYGDHCEYDGGSLTDSYTIANDSACNLSGTGSQQNIANLNLGPLSTATINGVEQSYHPLLDGSPAIDAGPAHCEVMIDDDTTVSTDQLGSLRPHHYYCDIGAIESSLADELLCANNWTGQMSMDVECGRSATFFHLPQDAPLTLCVNDWNGATRVAADCSRSEHAVIATGDHSIDICVNKWNGALRVSNQCSRSETQHWL